MSNKKKIVIICSMVLLLVAAAFLNVFLSKDRTEQSGANVDDTAVTVSFFNSLKSERETTRNQSVSYLDAIINSETSSAEAIDAAQTRKLELINTTETELVLESLIRAKGFEDAFVTLETNNVNVLVKDSALDSEGVAKILTVVTEETGVKATNVVIQPCN